MATPSLAPASQSHRKGICCAGNWIIDHVKTGDTLDGDPHWMPSLSLPDDFIKGAAGAGDAFFAGVLFGLHEDWPLDRSLRLAHGAAAR